MLDKGREILMKDKMIDEEKAEADAAENEELENNVTSINDKLNGLTDSMASFLAEYKSFQIKIKKRITSLEAKKGLIGDLSDATW